MTYLRRPARSRTLDRIAAMRRLTKLLGKGEMRRDDIAHRMKMSQSGCRKYLADLTDGAIVALSRREPVKSRHIGQPVYKLIATAEKIEQFLQDAVTVVPEDEPRKVKTTPGRHFHIMADDTHYSVRVSRAPVAPDPFALPVEFFRSAAGACV
jgi:Mn-dependent DtxR family transcriptional regulator